jgi:hypothetical protein
MSPNTDKKADTTDYSASKAPETVEHAENKELPSDHRLEPGGPRGTRKGTGMSGMDPEDVPALDPKADKRRPG